MARTNEIKEKVVSGLQPIIKQLLETEKQVHSKVAEIHQTLKELPCKKGLCVDKLLDADKAIRLLAMLNDSEIVKQGKALGQNLKSKVSCSCGEDMKELKAQLARMEQKLTSLEHLEPVSRSQFQKLSKKVEQVQSRMAVPKKPA